MTDPIPEMSTADFGWRTVPEVEFANAIRGAFQALIRTAELTGAAMSGLRVTTGDGSIDEYRHLPGIPGVSDKCWADKWVNTCSEPHIHDENCDGFYTECNEEAVNDLGTCQEHDLSKESKCD